MTENFGMPGNTGPAAGHVPKPSSARNAQIMMWIQVALSALGCVLVFVLISDAVAHNQDDGLGLVGVLGALTLLQGVVVAVCAARLGPGQPGVLTAAIAVEWLVAVINTVGALISLTSGAFQPTVVVSILLPVAIAVQLGRPETRAWCDSAPSHSGPAY